MAEGDEKMQHQVSPHTSDDKPMCSSSQVLLMNPQHENTVPQQQEEDKRIKGSSSSANYFHRLLHRQISGKRTRESPFIFRDHYHVHAFDIIDASIAISDVVLAGELLLLFSTSRCTINPYYTRDGDIKPVRPRGTTRSDISYVCYNSNNDSLIIVTESHNNFRYILSLQISAIEAGRYLDYRVLFRESHISRWEFDISNCRGIIHNMNEKVLKVFELKEYNLLFTIRDEEGYGYFASDLGFLGPRNKEMLILYKKNSLGQNAEILLRIYSKSDGQLCKETRLPIDPEHNIEFVVLCGTTGKILLQQSEAPMKIIDISSNVSPIIKITDIHAACCPYYLERTKKFICYTRSNSLHVYDLKGDILVQTFEDHQLCWPNLFQNSYVTNVESLLISVCSNGSPDLCTINASSIITGKCLAKIRAEDNSDSEENIKKSALKFIKGFVLDEKRQDFLTINNNRICRWSDELCSDIYTKIE